MKYKRWHTHLICVFYAFLFSFCTVGCFVTGWDLSIPSGRWLLFWCGLFSVLTPLFLYFRYGGWGIAVLAVCSGLLLWRSGTLWEQIQSLVSTISSHYEKVYGWSSIGTMLTDETDLVMLLMGFLTVLSVSLCICGSTHFAMCLPVLLIPLMVCLMTTDTLPDERILFLFMFGIVMMLLTDWTRRKNPERFPALTLRVFVPAAAALALLFVLNPQDAYVNRAAQLQKDAVQMVQKVQSAAESVVNGSFTDSIGAERLNLRSAGPKNNLTYSVMRITSPYSGTVYLRGRDYDVYTGTAWEATEERVEFMPIGIDSIGTMRITTYSVRDVLYVPYCTIEGAKLVGGRAENSENLKSYSYTIGKTMWGGQKEYGYTALPEETLEWAAPVVQSALAGIPADTSVEKKVQILGTYVRDSADYDLSAPSMRGGYDDFARWFLEESGTGYCVHFATAAAVLLRAAGIPARYVEGYAVNCQADAATLVTNQSAHAWVEYYDEDQGKWNILDATPGEAVLTGEILTDEEENEEVSETEDTETDEPSADETESADETTPGDGEQPTGIPGTEAPGSPDSPGRQEGFTGSPEDSAGSPSGGTVSEKEPFEIPGWAKAAGWIFLCTSLVPVTGYIRIALKRKQWNAGTPNEMAITRWKQSERMAKQMKVGLPDELEELALKAKFSQHTITDAELERFTLFRKLVLEEIDRMPRHRRWLYRWIHAIG